MGSGRCFALGPPSHSGWASVSWPESANQTSRSGWPIRSRFFSTKRPPSGAPRGLDVEPIEKRATSEPSPAALFELGAWTGGRLKRFGKPDFDLVAIAPASAGKYPVIAPIVPNRGTPITPATQSTGLPPRRAANWRNETNSPRYPHLRVTSQMTRKKLQIIVTVSRRVAPGTPARLRAFSPRARSAAPPPQTLSFQHRPGTAPVPRCTLLHPVGLRASIVWIRIAKPWFAMVDCFARE
jgi:hypothetical protein